MSRFLPGSPAPDFVIPLTDGRLWSLSDQRPQHFTMIVIYRHGQCSICSAYLRQLDMLVHDFAAVGTQVLAASVDDAANSLEMKDRLGLQYLALGCGLTWAMGRDWGLFASEKRKNNEPDTFFEPAIFLIDPDRRLYYSIIQSMPFGRPPLDDILQWIPKVIDGKIGARGEMNVT